MAEKKADRYIEGIGRRKRAIARVRIMKDGKGTFIVNDRKLDDYFATEELQKIAKEALVTVKKEKDFSVSVHISGGGIRAQAEAVRLGTARALVEYDKDLRGELKSEGFLMRDPRVKERKKFGLKKARRAPQWSKR